MPIFQLTGLSGAGKSTISLEVAKKLSLLGHKVEILDGDETRKTICKDLGFSKEDRLENIERLGFIGNLLSKHGIIVLIAAINPYESARQSLTKNYRAKTIWIKCDIETLKKRDTKGLYKRAMLTDNSPNKIHNLTGISDTFETPLSFDLMVDTAQETIEESVESVTKFVLSFAFTFESQ